MKFAVMSLGCRLNTAEIQSLSTALQEAGHELTDRDNACLHIINSCGVTAASERKTRRLLYRSIECARPGIKIILTGCCAETQRREGSIYYISNDYKYLIPDIVSDWSLFERIETRGASRFAFKPAKRSSKTRINIKIQDGCDNFCTYCVIPIVRGAPVSRPLSAVLDELRELADAGYKEFLLTGVCIGSYSYDGQGLPYLLEKLLLVPGNFRVHLSSISPLAVDEHIADILQHPKMVKHLSLSLQSGSGRILEKMNRGYSPSAYMEKLELVRKKNQTFNFTTDIIVGFPGETDDDFAATLELVRSAGFSHVHIFRYSPRPGTKAAQMTDRVPEHVKSARGKILSRQCAAQKKKYYESFQERESVFLSEGAKNGVSRGFNEYYVPVESNTVLPANEFFRIRTRFSEKRSILTGDVL
ncbi:MAG: MiaB/RimO family radical SAM methylthiotransferase [Spirochaetia bacterium]|jgi:threonylcarbamoyladenosine tRNA methylthiotransferase MtaB|nr:MiaB/RimO family radical SAM methylthiotransferase [Spirochaetia bacterium]